MAVAAKTEMTDFFASCTLCPRNCRVNRHERVGYCGERDVMRVSRAALHFWEEPCISGERGSGTVFFVGCPLKCSYCQNYDISRSRGGGEITVARLSEIFFELKAKGAHNINLVTPTHFAPPIIEAIRAAKDRGFDLPFICNCGGYESVDTIKMLEGYIDVFIPDFKYYSSESAGRYSNAQDYVERAKAALEEMVRTVGEPIFSADGMMTRGVIIRHLVLPSHVAESIEIFKYVNKKYGNGVYVSVMNQYTPMATETHDELKRKTTTYEYQKAVSAAKNAGTVNGFVQDGATQDASFIPPFDMTGVYSP